MKSAAAQAKARGNRRSFGLCGGLDDDKKSKAKAAALKAAALRLDLKAEGDRGSFGRCGGLDDDNKKGGGPPHNGVQGIAIL